LIIVWALSAGQPIDWINSEFRQLWNSIFQLGSHPDRWDNDFFLLRRSKMSDKSFSNTSSKNGSDDAMGTLLMIVLSMLAAAPLIIGYWAALTGGGF
jgi:hypothetical protein